MKENLIQNEHDALTEININILYFKDLLENMPNLKLNKYDRKFLINSYINTTNNALNTALLTEQKFDFFNDNNLKNNVLPDNYVKPTNIKLLQDINKLNNTQIKLLHNYLKQILKGEICK